MRRNREHKTPVLVTGGGPSCHTLKTYTMDLKGFIHKIGDKCVNGGGGGPIFG